VLAEALLVGATDCAQEYFAHEEEHQVHLVCEVGLLIQGVLLLYYRVGLFNGFLANLIHSECFITTILLNLQLKI